MDYVVVRKDNEENYTSGLGFQNRSLLKALGFPPAPYSKAGAKTLVRQIKSMRPKLELSVVEYKE